MLKYFTTNILITLISVIPALSPFICNAQMNDDEYSSFMYSIYVESYKVGKQSEGKQCAQLREAYTLETKNIDIIVQLNILATVVMGCMSGRENLKLISYDEFNKTRMSK